jgi:hypothetical protein
VSNVSEGQGTPQLGTILTVAGIAAVFITALIVGVRSGRQPADFCAGISSGSGCRIGP